MSNNPEVILVNLGVFQPYIKQSIKNLQLFGNQNITVIIDPDLSKHFKKIPGIRIIFSDEFDLSEFDEKFCRDESFRNGFLKNTSKRLFYLHQYMKKYNRQNCFHIENDVMVYKNLQSIIPPRRKLWFTMENPARAIASLMFIPDYSFLNPLLKNYKYDRNDMKNLGEFYNSYSNQCETFPLNSRDSHYPFEDIFTRNFELFNCVFDAAAIGQYLGGLDPRNPSGKRRRKLLSFLRIFGLDHLRLFNIDTRGMVSKTCDINYSHYKFGWIKVSGLHVPHIKISGNWVPIANLHIHCKWLKNFRADNPKETKLIPVLDFSKK